MRKFLRNANISTQAFAKVVESVFFCTQNLYVRIILIPENVTTSEPVKEDIQKYVVIG